MKPKYHPAALILAILLPWLLIYLAIRFLFF